MKVIIAKTYEQFVNGCHQNCLRVSETPFINSVTAIDKLSGVIEPLYIGDFWKLPGYQDIERVLKSRGIKVAGKRILVK